MRVYQNILETIGNTPMVKLNSITKDLPCTVYAKVETTNPGNSIKDRMALKMIEDAEASGALKPEMQMVRKRGPALSILERPDEARMYTGHVQLTVKSLSSTVTT